MAQRDRRGSSNCDMVPVPGISNSTVPGCVYHQLDTVWHFNSPASARGSKLLEDPCHTPVTATGETLLKSSFIPNCNTTARRTALVNINLYQLVYSV